MSLEDFEANWWLDQAQSQRAKRDLRAIMTSAFPHMEQLEQQRLMGTLLWEAKTQMERDEESKQRDREAMWRRNRQELKRALGR